MIYNLTASLPPKKKTHFEIPENKKTTQLKCILIVVTPCSFCRETMPLNIPSYCWEMNRLFLKFSLILPHIRLIMSFHALTQRYFSTKFFLCNPEIGFLVCNWFFIFTFILMHKFMCFLCSLLAISCTMFPTRIHLLLM